MPQAKPEKLRLPPRRRIVLFATGWTVLVACSEASVDALYQWLTNFIVQSLTDLGYPTEELEPHIIDGALRTLHEYSSHDFTLTSGHHRATMHQLAARRRPVNAVEVLDDLTTTVAFLVLTIWNIRFPHQRELGQCQFVTTRLLDHPEVGLRSPLLITHCSLVLGSPFNAIQHQVEQRLAELAHPTAARSLRFVPVRRPKSRNKPASREM